MHPGLWSLHTFRPTMGTTMGTTIGLPWAQVADNWVCNFGLHLPLQASPVTDTPGDDDQLTSVDQGDAYL